MVMFSTHRMTVKDIYCMASSTPVCQCHSTSETRQVQERQNGGLASLTATDDFCHFAPSSTQCLLLFLPDFHSITPGLELFS
mmetsp:Transcript_10253/g.19681  ORF Transcript_10253/g.19681 Transcript_10253/m.19681 type:complete len:82 (-) Transcript_10253:69-314(-)